MDRERDRDRVYVILYPALRAALIYSPGLRSKTSTSAVEAKATGLEVPDLARPPVAMTLRLHAAMNTAAAHQALLDTAIAPLHEAEETATAVRAHHHATTCSGGTTGTIVTGTEIAMPRLRDALLLLHGTGIVVRSR